MKTNKMMIIFNDFFMSYLSGFLYFNVFFTILYQL